MNPLKEAYQNAMFRLQIPRDVEQEIMTSARTSPFLVADYLHEHIDAEPISRASSEQREMLSIFSELYQRKVYASVIPNVMKSASARSRFASVYLDASIPITYGGESIHMMRYSTVGTYILDPAIFVEITAYTMIRDHQPQHARLMTCICNNIDKFRQSNIFDIRDENNVIILRVETEGVLHSLHLKYAGELPELNDNQKSKTKVWVCLGDNQTKLRDPQEIPHLVPVPNENFVM